MTTNIPAPNTFPPSNFNYWINLEQFSTYELVVTGIGWIFWISLYILIVVHIRKSKYVEMPWICVLGNISWEFVWGFFFYDTINLGELFIWSYRAWFFLDIFILWGLFKYGRKQLNSPDLKKYFVPICIFFIAFWICLYSSFIASNFDHKWGSQSAYISNIVISILFLELFLRQGKTRRFSKVMAWCKCLGTLAYTIVYFNFDYPNIFVHVAGFTVLVLDIIYLYLLYTRQPKDWQPEATQMQTA